MPDTDVLVLFFATSVLLGLAPGPDNFFVLTQSALRGHLAGIVITLGLCTGLMVHTAAVALGVAAMFQASRLAFNALKLAGAAYLLWLAWQAFRASGRELAAGPRDALSPWRLYRRGILMNITNPKVSIFFLAFLPQFADPTKGPVAAQMMLLGAIFIVATLIVFGSISLAAGVLGQRLGRSPGIQRALNIITGVVFAGLALRLAIAEQ